MLNIIYTTSFKKDFKKVSKQGKNLPLIKEIISKLIRQIPLDKKHREHTLAGNYKDKKECHITPDWLLIYEIDGKNLILHRTGSHSELFKK